MIQDKNFKLYLIDGTAQGKIRCTTDNWAGVALKIPKTQIENCANISELNHAGIYFLFGESAVYIGAGKFKSVGDFWDDAIFFTYKENSFEMTGLKFLKDKFTKKIAAANRYEIKSDNEIFSENISEEKKSTLELFAGYVETILYFLGYKIFEPPKEISAAPPLQLIPESLPAPQPPQPEADDATIFYLSKKIQSLESDIKAQLRVIPTRYTLLAGSQISPVESELLPEIIKLARINAKISSENILQENITFKKPSSAAEFVTGLSTDGYESWKTKQGKTLNKFLNRKPSKK